VGRERAADDGHLRGAPLSAPLAVVLQASGPNALGIVRSLGRAGVRVIACDHDPRALGLLSRYATPAHTADPLTEPDRFVDDLLALGEGEARGGVLFPTHDEAIATCGLSQSSSVMPIARNIVEGLGGTIAIGLMAAVATARARAAKSVLPELARSGRPQRPTHRELGLAALRRLVRQTRKRCPNQRSVNRPVRVVSGHGHDRRHFRRCGPDQLSFWFVLDHEVGVV